MAMPPDAGGQRGDVEQVEERIGAQIGENQTDDGNHQQRGTGLAHEMHGQRTITVLGKP